MLVTKPMDWSDLSTKDSMLKREVRTQFAALCYRVKASKTQILLVTSRGTGRWIIPKGWPTHGQSAPDSAAIEAWEEAGATGKIGQRPLGIFSYVKGMGPEKDLPCLAMVFPLKVRKLEKDYPEHAERRRKWVSVKKAAAMVDTPELARIIKHFDPRQAM